MLPPLLLVVMAGGKAPCFYTVVKAVLVFKHKASVVMITGDVFTHWGQKLF